MYDPMEGVRLLSIEANGKDEPTIAVARVLPSGDIRLAAMAQGKSARMVADMIQKWEDEANGKERQDTPER